MLVLLRVSVGWHFYREGVKKKLSGDFSSEGFLRQAKGPLASSYKAMLPDNYGFDGYVDELLEFKEGESLDIRSKLKPPKRKKGEPKVELRTPLHDWADQVAKGWGEHRVAAEKHYGYSEEQKAQSQQLFEMRRRELDATIKAAIAWLKENPDFISYYVTLRRRAESEKTPFSSTRLAAQTGEIKPLTRELPAEVKKLEKQFQVDLRSLLGLTKEQLSKAPLAERATLLERFDSVMIYSHIAIGVCLMIGLFSRLAALGGAFFLLSVVASQPLAQLFEISVNKPLAPGTDPIYLLVEALVMLALATTAVGRWAGLDFFIHKLCSKCCRSKGTNDAS